MCPVSMLYRDFRRLLHEITFIMMIFISRQSGSTASYNKYNTTKTIYSEQLK